MTDKTDALLALDIAIEQACQSRVTLHLTRAKQIREALAAQPVCTCPSGDGSLRWPCPSHSAEQPAGAVGDAWAEGYAAGVTDERTSEANIGIAGYGAKVEPARENPYTRATPSAASADVDGLRKWIDDGDAIPAEIIEARRDAIRLEFGNDGTDDYDKGKLHPDQLAQAIRAHAITAAWVPPVGRVQRGPAPHGGLYAMLLPTAPGTPAVKEGDPLYATPPAAGVDAAAIMEVVERYAGKTANATKYIRQDLIKLLDSAGGAKGEALTDTYVQKVPDRCDRIIWRGQYLHLPNMAAQPDGGDRAAFPKWVEVTVPRGRSGTYPDGSSWGSLSSVRVVQIDADDWREFVAKLSRPSAAAAVPEGFVLVPREATPEMVDAWTVCNGGPADAYRAMLAAAPAAPEGGVVDWSAVEGAAREFIDGYEMMGEDESGREGSYTPNEREKMLIMDAMFGLFADADFIAALATPRAEQGDVDERCESGDPECGPVEFHDSEGVPLCKVCWDALIAEQGGQEVGNG